MDFFCRWIIYIFLLTSSFVDAATVSCRDVFREDSEQRLLESTMVWQTLRSEFKNIEASKVLEFTDKHKRDFKFLIDAAATELTKVGVNFEVVQRDPIAFVQILKNENPNVHNSILQKLSDNTLAKLEVKFVFDPYLLLLNEAGGMYSYERILFLDLDTVLSPNKPSDVFIHEYRHAFRDRRIDQDPTLESLMSDAVLTFGGRKLGDHEYADYFSVDELAQHTHDAVYFTLSGRRDLRRIEKSLEMVNKLSISLQGVVDLALVQSQKQPTTKPLNSGTWFGALQIVKKSGSFYDVIIPDNSGKAAFRIILKIRIPEDAPSALIKERIANKLKDHSKYMARVEILLKDLYSAFQLMRRSPTEAAWSNFVDRLRKLEKENQQVMYRQSSIVEAL